ncbi:MAG: hypothetical protein RBQ94_03335 [Methanimicrococcus sp.]|nr:hypothetical protein [Methanimicrococcus sp.]
MAGGDVAFDTLTSSGTDNSLTGQTVYYGGDAHVTDIPDAAAAGVAGTNFVDWYYSDTITVSDIGTMRSLFDLSNKLDGNSIITVDSKIYGVYKPDTDVTIDKGISTTGFSTIDKENLVLLGNDKYLIDGTTTWEAITSDSPYGVYTTVDNSLAGVRSAVATTGLAIDDALADTLYAVYKPTADVTINKQLSKGTSATDGSIDATDLVLFGGDKYLISATDTPVSLATDSPAGVYSDLTDLASVRAALGGSSLGNGDILADTIFAVYQPSTDVTINKKLSLGTSATDGSIAANTLVLFGGDKYLISATDTPVSLATDSPAGVYSDLTDLASVRAALGGSSLGNGDILADTIFAVYQPSTDVTINKKLSLGTSATDGSIAANTLVLFGGDKYLISATDTPVSLATDSPAGVYSDLTDLASVRTAGTTLGNGDALADTIYAVYNPATAPFTTLNMSLGKGAADITLTNADFVLFGSDTYIKSLSYFNVNDEVRTMPSAVSNDLAGLRIVAKDGTLWVPETETAPTDPFVYVIERPATAPFETLYTDLSYGSVDETLTTADFVLNNSNTYLADLSGITGDVYVSDETGAGIIAIRNVVNGTPWEPVAEPVPTLSPGDRVYVVGSGSSTVGLRAYESLTAAEFTPDFVDGTYATILLGGDEYLKDSAPVLDPDSVSSFTFDKVAWYESSSADLAEFNNVVAAGTEFNFDAPLSAAPTNPIYLIFSNSGVAYFQDSTT